MTAQPSDRNPRDPVPPAYTAGDAARIMHGEVVWGNPLLEFRGASFDSRHASRGELFFAIKGERTDGHLYLANAVSRGVSCLLVSRWDDAVRAQLTVPTVAAGGTDQAITPAPDQVAVIQVLDTVAAIGHLARHHRARFPVPVIGVTGSVGKTTAKDMAAHILERRLTLLASEGNLNSDVSLPTVILRLNEQHQAALFEMGTRGHGQLEYLAGLAAPSVGVVTTVAPVHVETLGSLAGIARAKAELLRALPASGVAIYNADSVELGAELAAGGIVAWPVSFGFGEAADVRAADAVTVISRAGDRIEASLSFGVVCRPGATAERLGLPAGERLTVAIPYPGVHNVTNVLAAALAAAAVGVPFADGLEALSRFRPKSAMRLDISSVGGRVLVDDAYNANLLSMTAALEVLAGMPVTGRRIAVLGDMLELGPLAAETHRALGHQVARLGIDILVCVGPDSRVTANGAILDGMDPAVVHWTADREEAAAVALQLAQPGDAVLVKGSRGMALEHLVKALRQGWQV